MTTLHLTTEETRFLKARMRLTAMNESGTTANIAERILDLLCVADTAPREPRTWATPDSDLFIGGTA